MEEEIVNLKMKIVKNIIYLSDREHDNRGKKRVKKINND